MTIPVLFACIRAAGADKHLYCVQIENVKSRKTRYENSFYLVHIFGTPNHLKAFATGKSLFKFESKIT